MLLGILLALPAVFDGASWQDAAPCDALADTTYTVCARLTNTAPVSTTSRVAYSAASGTLSDQYAYLGINNNLLPECMYRSNITASAKGSSALPSGEHSIFCVADGSALTLYVDGVARSSISLSGAGSGARPLCTVGALRRPSGTTLYWMGEIAAVQVWDRALTVAELTAGCSPAPPPVLENCHGHTGLTWDAYPEASVTHFEVERTVSGIDAWSFAGDTQYKNRPAWVDEYGETHPATRAEIWDLLRAWSLPVEGVHYSYRVRAVKSTGAKSIEPSNVVDCGPQDPTRCFPEACP